MTDQVFMSLGYISTWNFWVKLIGDEIQKSIEKLKISLEDTI
jgi:hypothetical protein